MGPIHPQYVVDENDSKKAVVLPLSEWEQILSELEELDDIRAYDQAKSTADEAIPFDQAVREIRNRSHRYPASR
jgi:PHD/YefM family antitoxin component YafN of YafNO toxin-antitoxin module